MSTENSSIIAQSTETIDSANPDKKRYYEPAPQDIDVDNFRKVIESRRSVRKFTKKQFQKMYLMLVWIWRCWLPIRQTCSPGHFMWYKTRRRKSDWSKPA